MVINDSKCLAGKIVFDTSRKLSERRGYRGGRGMVAEFVQAIIINILEGVYMLPAAAAGCMCGVTVPRAAPTIIVPAVCY